MHSESQQHPGPILTEKQAAEYAGFSVRTLQGWRVRGGGPQYSKIGRSIRYRQCDLDAFIEANLTTSTSEAGAK